jgi:long-chain acyl-CoA synthetase
MTAGLAALLADAAAAHASRPAILHEGKAVEYAELDALAARTAGLLRARAVGPGDRVGIRLPNGPSFVASFHGALRLGAIVVPLNPLLSASEVRQRLVDAGAGTIVAAEAEPAAGAAWVDPAAAPSAEPVTEVAERDPADTAVILYTSGTTSGARGAELTHAGLRAQADFVAVSLLRLTPADVVLGAVPLSHVFGLSAAMNAPIAAGACVAQMGRFEGRAALDLMARSGTTVFLGVPTMCIALLEAAGEGAALPPLRVAHSGGASLAPERLRAFATRFGCEVIEGYGMTEVGGVVATHRLGSAVKTGSVGTASDVVDLRVVDDCDTDLQPGEIGEVLVRGRTLMKGYWRDAGATDAALRAGGWLATGDMGYMDEDGYLFLVDRKKDVILRGGYTVYPREVEDVLFAHPDVLEAVVLGVADERLGEEIVALVVPKGGRRLDPDDVRDFARERVAAYKYPRLVLAVDGLPHGGSGKILRREIEREPLRRALDERLQAADEPRRS